MMTPVIALLVTLACLLSNVKGHGRLLEPPSRASMWRFGYDTPKNYDDNQLSCGGVGIQYSPDVAGRCGVCGDPWKGPRQNEAGGKYANGIIVRKYSRAQIINVTIELTANHKGFFEFRLCPTDDPFDKVKQECLDKHLLIDAMTGESRYNVPGDGYRMKFQRRLQLPREVKCRACLLQWKYNAGNSWGKSRDGSQCIGCGNQEQFYGCADIAIGYDDVILGKPVRKNPWIGHKDPKWHFGGTSSRNRTSGNYGSKIGYHPVCLYSSFLLVTMAVCLLIGD